MKKTKNQNRVNVRGDCKNCPDHGICLAEINKPDYYCTKNGQQDNKQK